MLHDCGKFFISSDLTTKPGALTQNEREMMETHPERILKAAVKGMLPKNALGRKLLQKLRIYTGEIHPHKAQSPQVISFSNQGDK